MLVALAGLALVIWINKLWGRVVRRWAGTLSKVPRLALRMTQPALLAGSYWVFHILVNLQVNIQGRFAEGEFLLHSS